MERNKAVVISLAVVATVTLAFILIRRRIEEIYGKDPTKAAAVGALGSSGDVNAADGASGFSGSSGAGPHSNNLHTNAPATAHDYQHDHDHAHNIAPVRLFRGPAEVTGLSELFAPPIRVSPPGSQHERGVSLALVNFFLQSLPHGDTRDTEAVMKQVMFPTTEASVACACDMLHGITVLDPSPRGSGSSGPCFKPALSAPTHFVSHAWSTAFNVTVAAVNAWCDENHVSVFDTYLWMDVFCLNQHTEVPGSRTMTEQELADAFARSVAGAGHTLFVCTPWHAPAALTRAWCLYEVLETMRARGGAGVPLSVCLPPSQRASFRLALLEDYERVERQGVLAVDVRKVEMKRKHGKQSTPLCAHSNKPYFWICAACSADVTTR